MKPVQIAVCGKGYEFLENMLAMCSLASDKTMGITHDGRTYELRDVTEQIVK